MLAASQFSSERVAHILWPRLIDEFGVEYIYHTAEGEETPGLTGILIEGVEGEPVSPGRYAGFWLDLRDLPREPRSADWIVLGQCDTYDVERVEGTLYDIARLVIKKAGSEWQRMPR